MINRTAMILVAVLVFGIIPSVSAAVPEVYTNDNFFTTEHDTPVSFTRNIETGVFTGVTKAGKIFSQRPVVTDFHVHLHCFKIDQASFYTSSYGLILAGSDTEALSIYLVRAGLEEGVV